MPSYTHAAILLLVAMEVFVCRECLFREGSITFDRASDLSSIILLTAALRIQQY